MRASLVLALLAVAACSAPEPILPTPGGVVVFEDVPLTAHLDTFRVHTDSLRYTAEIVYPRVRGQSRVTDYRMLNIANGAVLDSVWAVARTFRPTEAPRPNASPSQVATVQGSTDEVFVGGEILSALVSLYAYTGGAHGTTVFVPINRDVRTGRAIRLGDLFRPGTPWADTLSRHADRALVRKRMAAGAASPTEARLRFFQDGHSTSAMHRAAFTLGPDSLVIHFDHDEVAAYAFGTTRVPVAYSDLAPLLRPNGIVTRLRGAH